MFQFPFGTMHQLNLDWFLQQWQQLRQEWIDEEQHIEDSMQDVYDARDAAIQAKDDAVSAKNDAESAQAGVHADALMAEGFAVGEQGGTPVGPGSPYYQVNAKFYSANAGTYRYLSEAYARGTMGGTPVDPGDAGYEDNAKYYKEQADLDAQSASDDAAFANADALKAEGYAVGEQNGVPVSSGDPYYQDNAKYYAAEAQQDKEDADTFKDAANAAALRAEGYSSGTQNGTPVSSGSPYYENNAAYFYGLSAGTSGDLAQDMIAGTEATSTASQDYDIGNYFILNGQLYRVLATITSGDTLTPGTNCKQAALADDFSDENLYNEFKRNSLHNLVNYDYDVDTQLTAGSDPSSSNAIGAKRRKNIFYLSTNPLLSSNVGARIKASGAMQRQKISGSSANNTVNGWTGVTLINGHKYATILKKISGSYTQPSNTAISVSVYKEGTHSTVGTTLIATQDIHIRTFTYDGTPVSFCIFVDTDTIFTEEGIFALYLCDLTDPEYIGIASKITDYKEFGFTASRNYSVNDIISVNDDLYIITANIANGSTIVPGTNATQTTVGTLITAILNS